MLFSRPVDVLGGPRTQLGPTPFPLNRIPATSDVNYPIGQIVIYEAGNTFYGLASKSAGLANWVNMGSTLAGGIQTLTAGTGGPISPVLGNVNLAGTTNQITTTGSGNTITFSIPSVFIAPGSIAATTTVTAGTGITSTTGNIVASAGNISATLGSVAAGTTVTAGTSITATLGNITATNGNFVSSAVGKGLLFNATAATGAAASPIVLDVRAGQVVFTSVSIAAAADLTLTLTNSTITGASTQIIYSMSGATTGSALSMKSVTPSAGSCAFVVTNGTGATTTTADITITFLIVN